jgi:hypothetical protein
VCALYERVNAYIDLRILWKRGQSLIQRLVHLRRRTLEEPPASCSSRGFSINPLSLLRQANHTANEKCIPCENSFLLAILHKIANAILRMARRMQRRHGDPVSDLKDLAMSWSLRDGLTVFSANNGHLKGLQNLVVTTCMIPVAIGM